jgi:hypothetical protein
LAKKARGIVEVHAAALPCFRMNAATASYGKSVTPRTTSIHK